MARLTSDQKAALNNLFHYFPELGKSVGLDNPNIGSLLEGLSGLTESEVDDAAEAADAAPTKEEFDAVVALVNDLKAKLNSLAPSEG